MSVTQQEQVQQVRGTNRQVRAPGAGRSLEEWQATFSRNALEQWQNYQFLVAPGGIWVLGGAEPYLIGDDGHCSCPAAVKFPTLRCKHLEALTLHAEASDAFFADADRVAWWKPGGVRLPDAQELEYPVEQDEQGNYSRGLAQEPAGMPEGSPAWERKQRVARMMANDFPAD